ncbi:MAG: ribbon-helix-helix domain-containing protein [Desulfarculaceae bacterium]|nr:ribbon-helix-helix domain-containing protein [Desulfarculaceae bacterium]MCF8074253.1 ribbon-helix-helix domain-containing protein [Desulfarculaceae bacterium]MCF8102988.1 ribbon-helix-helix domain-containing protein [Desulfarculaceae bacterium]MCF8117119.1 ribbon-helix-helix domain-containing protein [Desulfarculaceae bacterium]
MKKDKPEVITFKAEPALVQAMEGIKNRSEFIRAAILSALDGVCPLCQGTGILTPQQKEHWESFSRHHKVELCDTCHARHLVCSASGAGDQGH